MATVLNGTRFLKNSATGDQSATIQAMLDDLSATGGILMLDPVDRADSYKISTPVTLRDKVHIVGTPPVMNSVANCPDLLPLMKAGTIFEALTSGYSCFVGENIDIANPSQGNAVNNSIQNDMQGLGFIGFTNAIKTGAINRIGSSFGMWSHLYFEDDDDAGLEMYNPQQMTINNIKFSNSVRGARFINDHATCQSGNSLITGYYCFTRPNPDYALLLESIGRDGYLISSLNFMQFHRPQMNCFSGTPGTNPGNANMILRGVDLGTGNSPVVNACEFYGTDTEGEMDHNFILDGCTNTLINIAGASSSADKIGLSSIKMRDCNVINVRSTSDQITTDIDSSNENVSWSGEAREHLDQIPLGTSRVVNYQGVAPDYRTLTQFTHSTNRNMSVADAVPSVVDMNGLDIGKRVRINNNTETVSKDRAGMVIEVGNTAAIVKTLPSAASIKYGTLTFIKTTADAFAITLDGDGSETVNGAATNAEMDAQWDTITIHSDGLNWKILNKVIS